MHGIGDIIVLLTPVFPL